MSSRLRALTVDLGPVDPGTVHRGTGNRSTGHRGTGHRGAGDPATDSAHGSFPHGELADALEHPDALCWIRRGEGHLGFGETARFTTKGADRFIEAEAWWKQLTLDAEVEDPLRHPGTGPLAFGSFAFSRTSAYESRLVVPELVVGIRDGRAWATQLTADGSRPSEQSLRAAVERWTTPQVPAGAHRTHLAVRPGSLG